MKSVLMSLMFLTLSTSVLAEEPIGDPPFSVTLTGRTVNLYEGFVEDGWNWATNRRSQERVLVWARRNLIGQLVGDVAQIKSSVGWTPANICTDSGKLYLPYNGKWWVREIQGHTELVPCGTLFTPGVITTRDWCGNFWNLPTLVPEPLYREEWVQDSEWTLHSDNPVLLEQRVEEAPAPPLDFERKIEPLPAPILPPIPVDPFAEPIDHDQDQERGPDFTSGKAIA